MAFVDLLFLVFGFVLEFWEGEVGVTLDFLDVEGFPFFHNLPFY